MNPRERYLETLLFGKPDRVPFFPGEPRESTLNAWAKQGLREGADWRESLMETLGLDREILNQPAELAVDFRMIPQFEERVLQRKDGHLIVQDWKGNICEISDSYDVTYLRAPKDFVTRRWLRCPVESREEWERIKVRYDIESPGRFPGDFEEGCKKAWNRGEVLTVLFPGPFWQMREWCGFERLCIMMADEENWVAEMASFWTEFVAALLERILHSALPDAVVISEDMAFKGRAMISPEMTRKFCKPSYDRWAALLRTSGCRIIDLDSDGYIHELVPLWIESGINVCNPVEVAAHNDICALRREFGHRMAYRGGVDKRAIAKGGQVLFRELKRIEPVLNDGGFIPGCDHGVPPDISWPNFIQYCRLLAQMTGWL